MTCVVKKKQSFPIKWGQQEETKETGSPGDKGENAHVHLQIVPPQPCAEP